MFLALIRTPAALSLTLFLACSSHAATKAEPPLSLDDCQVLMGQKQVSAYKKWRADALAMANQGHRGAIRALAGVANNLMACHEEALVPDQGWTVTTSTGDGSSETNSPPGIPDIAKRPAVLADLKDLVARAHAAGAFDPAYKRISAEWVAKYAVALGDAKPQAYEDAAGAYQLDCVLKHAIGKRDVQYSCQADRRVLAQLLPGVPAAFRAQADQRAAQWAQRFNPAWVDED